MDTTRAASLATDSQAHITVRNLTMAYGSFVIMRDLNFTIRHGDVFVIMGGSGCGKSTLLRHFIGLNEPASGEILYGTESFTAAEPARRQQMLRRFGVLYQSGALIEHRSEEHTSELQSRSDLVCRLLLEKKKNNHNHM